MDKRNYDVTNKMFSVLNDTKGFEVAMGAPSSGKLLIKYSGTTYRVEVSPAYRDNDVGSFREKQAFEDIVAENCYWFNR